MSSAGVGLDLNPHVVYSVKNEAVDVHGVTGWGERLTRLFWQVVQVVIFPVGLYRYFAGRTVFPQWTLDTARRMLDGYRRVRIETVDGVKLDAVQRECAAQEGKPRAQQKWVIVLSAKDGCYEYYLRRWSSERASVLAFNYRGVVESEGYQWSDFDPAVDAEAAVQYLLSLGVSEENIEIRGTGFKDVVGRSLMKHHPGLQLSLNTKLSMQPNEVSFKVREDVFGTYLLVNVIKKVFWEIVYLPLIAIRALAISFPILPGVGIVSKRDVDTYRDQAFDYLEQQGSEVKIKRHTIQTIDRVKLDTYEFVHPESSKEPAEQKWIVFCHGNGGTTESMITGFEAMVRDTGANVYSGNYRGVGYSQSFPWRSQDLELDGEAMVQHLLSRGVRPENIMLHGWSMGGGAAAAVAAKHPGMHLCSDRSFASFPAAAQELIGKDAGALIGRVVGLAAKFLSWTFDSVENYRKVTGEKFVMYHPKDHLVGLPASLHVGLGEPGDDIDLSDPFQRDDHDHHCAFLPLDRADAYEAGYQEYLTRVRRILRLQVS